MKKLFLVQQDVSHLRGEYFTRAVVMAGKAKKAIKAVLDLSRAYSSDSTSECGPEIICQHDRLAVTQIGSYAPRAKVEAVNRMGEALVLAFATGSDWGD